MIAETQNIRDLRQWVCWRREQRDGKPTKVPYSPLTGERASSTDPNSWASYSEAVAAYKEHGYDGIGFTFTKEDDFVGIDLDNCLSPDSGEVEPWAQEIIDELDSYAEVSPSGTGVHILVRATLPEGRNRKGPIEMYSHGRYFTVTGRHLEGTPRAIESWQQALEEVVRQVFEEKPESANGHKKEWSPYRNGLSDQEILAAAIRSKTRKKFSQLWTGEISGYDSTSEADQALCSMLAFWTGPDPGRIDALFKQSGLYRKKWERADYRDRTISKALDGRTEFYQPEQTAPINMEGTNTTDSDFGQNKELVELPEAPPFPVDALPQSCRRFVKEAATAIGCAPDLVAVPLLGLLSSAIGNSRQVQLKRGWKESAALFAVVVAEPGDKKTPAQKAALAPLWQAQKRLKTEYQAEHEVFEEELRRWEVERKTAGKEAEPAPARPKEPVLRSVVVDDVTVERLADILDENPRGVTSAQDELSGWVLAMNQYKAGGKGADRQFWLRVWSNAPVKVDRKSRKVPAIIAEPWVSVVGSIQPEILPELNIGRNDGMLDRFLYSYPEPQYTKHTDHEVSATAEHTVFTLYGKLADLKMPESDGEPFPGTVPMTKEAWEVFKELADELSEEAHALDFPRRLRGAWSKLEAYLARLSLILALSRLVESDEREQVEPRDVFAASVLINYFKAHIRRVFVELHGKGSMDLLAAALKAFLEEHGGSWEGTATELKEVLAGKEVEGLPPRPEELSKKVRAMGSRSQALNMKDGWRRVDGRPQRFMQLSLRNAVDAVDAVDKQSMNVNTVNRVNSVYSDTEEDYPDEKITREPDGTPPLSDGGWEEV
jgi:putative DNA primase/helicase